MSDLTRAEIDELAITAETDAGYSIADFEWEDGAQTLRACSHAILQLLRKLDEATTQSDARVGAALREAAHMIAWSAYTTNGDERSLQPVAKGYGGADMHHATISDAVIDMNPTATAALARALERLRERLIKIARQSYAATSWPREGQLIEGMLRQFEALPLHEEHET